MMLLIPEIVDWVMLPVGIVLALCLSILVRKAERIRKQAAWPKPGDAVDRWLRRQRDACERDALRTHYAIVDNLLDDYRWHAITGTPLTEEITKGGRDAV